MCDSLDRRWGMHLYKAFQENKQPLPIAKTDMGFEIAIDNSTLALVGCVKIHA